jgi:hypothetical protein
MLLEVVQAWPHLLALCAVLSKALVTLAITRIFAMNRFLMSVQIIDSGKAFD